MSFKVEIEIEGYKEDNCWGCPYQGQGYMLIYSCLVYGVPLDKDVNGNQLRCPECLEAEIKYKEKVNAKVSAP